MCNITNISSCIIRVSVQSVQEEEGVKVMRSKIRNRRTDLLSIAVISHNVNGTAGESRVEFASYSSVATSWRSRLIFLVW